MKLLSLVFPRLLYTVLWISTPSWNAWHFSQLLLSQVSNTGAVKILSLGQAGAVSVQKCYLHQNTTEVPHSPHETAVFSPCNLFCSCSAALCQSTKIPPRNDFYRESSTQDPAFNLKVFCICMACLAEMGERWKAQTCSCQKGQV